MVIIAAAADCTLACPSSLYSLPYATKIVTGAVSTCSESRPSFSRWSGSSTTTKSHIWRLHEVGAMSAASSSSSTISRGTGREGSKRRVVRRL
jgi:hypothetical protein